MSGALNHIYRSISQPLSDQCAGKLVDWRNKATSGLDGVGRKIVTGVALLPLGIMSIVEATASLALAILTAPAEIAGLHFSEMFLHRSKQGGRIASQSLILFPIANIFKKRLDSINLSTINTPFLLRALDSLLNFRFRSNPTGLDKGMRRVATGVGLTVLGVLGYVETIMSFALGILTAPGAIVGTSFSDRFFKRAFASGLISSYALTLLQVRNFDINVPKLNVPKYNSLQRVYRVIETPLSQRAAQPLKKWRNQGAPGVDKTVRTIVRGVALGGLEITSLIESIASFTLGLLTTPAEIVGIRFSTHFFVRSHVLLQFRSLVD